MNWDKVIDFIQQLMIFLLISIVAFCILFLIFFDVVVGAGSMLVLTQRNVSASFGISMATSGLLMSLMFIGYLLSSKDKVEVIRVAGGFILFVAFLIYLEDVYFDSLTADYLRYTKFVAIKELPNVTEKVTQLLFRSLIGGISTIGETLGIAIILGMPVLKKIIGDSLPKNKEKQENKDNSRRSTSNTAKFSYPNHNYNKPNYYNRLPKDRITKG